MSSSKKLRRSLWRDFQRKSYSWTKYWRHPCLLIAISKTFIRYGKYCWRAKKHTQILMQSIHSIGSQHSSSERNLAQSCWRHEKQGRRSTSQQTFARWLELVQRCWCVNCCGRHKSAGATIGHRELQRTNLRHHQNREASHPGVGGRFKLAEDVDFIFDSENRGR